jgi:hypothetical protein
MGARTHGNWLKWNSWSAWQGSSHPLIGPKPALRILYLQRLSGGSSGTGRVGNTRSIGSPYTDKGRLKAFFKKPSAKKAHELLNQSRNQLRIMTGLLTEYCHLKGHLFKLGLLNRPEYNGCKQASETASHVLCDCEALATLIQAPGSSLYETRWLWRQLCQ